MKRQLLLLAASALLPLASMASRPHNFPKPAAKSWELPALTGNPSLDAWHTKAALGKDAEMLKATPSAQFDNASDWGILTCEDGKQLVYTAIETAADDFGSFISSKLVTIYNETGGELGTIDIKVPEGYICNSIQLLPEVTSKFFDFNSSTQEVVVSMHVFDADYNMGWITSAYEIGATEPKFTCDGIVAKFYNNYVNSWTQTQILVVERESEADGEAMVNLDVYHRGGWGDDGPVVAHTFTMPEKLLYYSEFAPYFNIYNIEGKTYYAVSHYELGYMDPASELDYTQDPVPQEGNSYIVSLYDTEFNSVATLSVPVEQTEDYLYTFYGFGAFSRNDLVKDVFAPGLNFIITKQCYVTGSDDYRYFIEAYTADGEKVADIASAVVDWKQLFTLPGMETQYAFIKENADSEQYISLLNYPSLSEGEAIFPSLIDGNLISFNFDRYANVDGDIQYVFSLANGDVDDEGNVYALIAWLDEDATINHIDRIPLGPDCIYYSAVIYGEYLSPYIFNTDNYYEYIGIAKIRKENDPDQTNADNILVIANSNEQVLDEFRGDEQRGAYWYGGLINTNQLYVVYLNQDTWLNSVDLYNLPFGDLYAGGDGTPESPYLIATPGDLMMVKEHPNAAYKLVADLDMGYFPQGWEPIENFGGTLDGSGFTVWNLKVDTNAFEAGLIGNLIGESAPAVIKNLNFDNASLTINTQNNSAGLIAGTAINAKISDIYVDGLAIDCSGNGYTTAGGLLGNAYINTSATSCGIKALDANVTGVETFGGIIGEARTGSFASVCAVDGNITGSSQIGGIIGSTVTGDEAALNCAVKADIKGKNTLGGIVGSGRPAIKNCIFRGSLTPSQASWNGFATGGIIGYLAPDWSDSGIKTITGNIMYGAINAEADGTVHRIAGYTVANEEDLEMPMTEGCLADNYVPGGNGALAPFDAEIGATDSNSVEGADATITEEFMAGIGYIFGASVAEPWVYSYSGFPTIFFMAADDITLSCDKATLAIDTEGEFTISFTVDGYDANALIVSVPDILQEVGRVVNGNTVTITLKPVANGEALVTAHAGFASASCIVTVTAFSGIESIADGCKLAIICAGGEVIASGEIAVYDMRGNIVARGAGSVEIKSLSKGVYIAVAVDGNRRAALKFVK